MEPILFAVPAPLTVEADDTGERRLLGGLAVPFGTVGMTSAGPVEFLAGSLPAADGVPVVRGHNDDALIGSVRLSSVDETGVGVRARLSRTPLADETLALAEDGILAGFSVSAVPLDFTFRADDTYGQVMSVTAAEYRHLGVVQRPAYPAAAITQVAASHQQEVPLSTITASLTPTEPPDEPDDPEEPEEVRAAAPEPARPAVTHVREAFPYTFDGTGPSLLRDYVAAQDGDHTAAARIVKAQAMLRDPRLVLAASQRMASRVDAATGTTVAEPSIVPPVYRPDLYTPLLAYEAPIYSALHKVPISDFSPFTIPTEATRTGLSGTPADEITPVAAGDITTALTTITPVHVMGSYAFSRDLAMSSNPAIDMIANNAMQQEWQRDVEARAIAYFEAAGHSTVGAGANYTTGAAFVKDARVRLATFRTLRKASATVIVSPTAEYLAAVNADDSTARPLLGWDGAPAYNPVGGQNNGSQEANILGIPLYPEGAAPLGAKKTHYIRSEDAWCFETPVFNFRFEASGTNPLVITLVKYSGVAFWTRRVQGYVTVLNAGTNPTADVLAADDDDAPEANHGRAKK